MVAISKSKLVAWLAPAFLLGLVAIFIVAPWTVKSKLDAIGYGI